MSYEENLQHVAKTRIVLEIMQEKAFGASLRVWESMMYDKLLLTNNSGLTRLDIYNPRYMHVIDKDSLTIGDWINELVCYEDAVKDSIRPQALLEFIDALLQ